MNNILINIDAPHDIIITGIDGLRCLLSMVANSWAEGKDVTMTAREVKFTPSDNKPELIYCEVLPMTK